MNLTESIEQEQSRRHDVFDAMRSSRMNWRDAMVLAYGVATYELFLYNNDRPAWTKVFAHLEYPYRLWGDD